MKKSICWKFWSVCLTLVLGSQLLPSGLSAMAMSVASSEAAETLFVSTRAQVETFNRLKGVTPEAAKVDGIAVEEPAYRLLGLMPAVGETSVDLTWTPSADLTVYRRDDGVMVDGIGLNGATEKSVIGVVFPDIRRLERIMWAHYNVLELEERRIHLFVFDLNEKGNPTNTILYSAKSLECAPPVVTHDLCEPLETPRGCFVALAAADGESLSLGMDDGAGSEWPFVRKVNYFTIDYTNSQFVSGDNQGLAQNVFIRAYGVDKTAAEPSAAAMPVAAGVPKSETYDVWRFKIGEEANPGKWTKLNDAPLADAAYSDAAYGSLPMGAYRYAVDVNGATPAMPVISCMVYKDMHTTLEASVHTAVSGFMPKEVTATLTGTNELLGSLSYICHVKADGNLRFQKIFKGHYSLKISSPGFEPIERELDLSSEAIYDLGTIQLKEYWDAPWSLTVERVSEPGERKVSWNSLYALSEGVEEHADFGINSPGKIGWSYIDGDGGMPYGINNCTFPNTGLPLAFMAFNPSLTTPALSNLPPAIAHGGIKYFAAFSNMPSASGQPVPNNDWIISPELDFDKAVLFSFWAKSYQGDFPEKFKVWYSTGGKAEADFTHALTAEAVKVPADWTEYSYLVPKEAKYVAIQYVSVDMFIFMLDDLQIVKQESPALPLAFEIWLDGKVYDTVETLSLSISDLSVGSHTIGVKALYQTGVSVVTEQQFEVQDVAAGLTAVLKDAAGEPVALAKVTAKGEFTYTGVSGTQGSVRIDRMQGNGEYTLEIVANGYKPYVRAITLADDVLDLGDIELVDQPAKPGAVYAVETADGSTVNIGWRSPTDYRLFRKDDGTIEGGLGQNMGTDKTVVGAVYFEAAELYSISWMTATQGENTINLFIFDVDYAGMPTKTVLYEARGVQNLGLKWNTHYLERPVRCPNGFMLAVSAPAGGNVGLGADSGRDSIWPFVPKTNYLIQDYTSETEQFRLLDPQFARNVMLRAEGSIGLSVQSGAPRPKSASHYKIYRSPIGIGVRENYVCLSERQAATSFTDKTWTDVERGYYRYGVRSFYLNGDSSEMAVSNVIGKQMETAVAVNVMADGKPAAGALVRLQSETDSAFEALTDSVGLARFVKLPTGMYHLRIKKEGYADFAVYGMDFSVGPNYTVGPYTLTGMLPMPTGLVVNETSDPGSRILVWDEVPVEEAAAVLPAETPDFYLLDANRKATFYLYEVTLDGHRLGETAETTYRIGNLTNGRHTVQLRVKDGFSYSEPAEVKFTVKLTANEVLTEAAVAVYPNPVSGRVFNVRVPEPTGRLMLTDMQGHAVAFTENGNGLDRQLRLASDVKGLLLLRVETAGGMLTKKITVL